MYHSGLLSPQKKYINRQSKKKSVKRKFFFSRCYCDLITIKLKDILSQKLLMISLIKKWLLREQNNLTNIISLELHRFWWKIFSLKHKNLPKTKNWENKHDYFIMNG